MFLQFVCFFCKELTTSYDLQLALYRGVPQELWYLSDDSKYFNIFIDSENDYPFQSYSCQARPHANTLIDLRKVTTFNRYNYPYSECTVLEDNTLVVALEDRTLFDRVIQTGFAYSRQACLDVCEQTLMSQSACGCVAYDSSFSNYIFPSYPAANITLCDFYTSETNLACLSQFQVHVNASVFDYCMQRCPLECVDSFFEIHVSTQTDNSYMDTLRNYVKNFDFENDIPNGTDFDEYVYDNVIVVKLTCAALSHLQIEEEPKMTSEELLGELGGLFHIFMGMSLLSFVEIAECFALIVYFMFKSTPRRMDIVKID